MGTYLTNVVLFFYLFASAHQWSGHTVAYLKVTGHRYIEWCDYHCWWHCCSHSHRTEDITTTFQRCNPMWTHNGDENCNIPLCSPSCGHGKCLVQSNGDHRCDCPDGRTGPSCSQYECSASNVCYPGECTGGSHITCNCQQGFGESTCMRMPDTSTWKASVPEMSARLSYWKRGHDVTNEEYGLEIYSSENTTTKWTNMERFNWLNVSSMAMLETETPIRPSYVVDAKFGIISAVVKIDLTKLSGGALGADVVHDTKPCDSSISRDHPVSDVNCKMSDPNFAFLLESSDKLTLTVEATTGGFRTLRDKHGQNTIDYFTGGQTTSTSVSYRFDFIKPHFTGTKTEAFHTNNDFTKLPINLRWSGWTDDLSGMDRYTWEYFRLVANGDGDLHEVDKMKPEVHRTVNHTTPISYPLPITPAQPGMYSFLLEAVDKANNSMYMRRCVLYDPDSTVSTDNDHDIVITSAHTDSHGQYWMTSASTPILVSWKHHFLNYQHEHGKYLNRILKFDVQLVPGEDIYKRVDDANDDHEGGRTIDAIPNSRGIVKFETSHAVNKTGGKINEEPQTLAWMKGSYLNTSLTFTEAKATSGSTLTFWVRAFDVLNNKKTDSTSVSYDYTEPTIGKLAIKRNVPSAFPFSSKLEIPAIDSESGVNKINIQVIQVSDGHVLTNTSVPVQHVESVDCTDRITDCYCPSTLSVCYKRVLNVDISNCWFIVDKDILNSAITRMEVGVVNRAGLVTMTSTTVKDLDGLNGTKAYFGPTNVTVDKISQSGVRISWNHAPSCYPRTKIWISIGDSEDLIPVSKDAQYHDITNLAAGSQFTVKVISDYGGVKSDSVAVKFKTLDAPGFGIGAIAGIAVGGVLILTVLGVGIFLWRNQKSREFIRRHTTRRRGGDAALPKVNNDLRPKTTNVKPTMSAYRNKAYELDDDIYLYGSMEFTSEQDWHISKNNITLLREICVGRFAQIYKANHIGGKSRIVAAKVLKDRSNEDKVMLMTAKINFFATQVGEHRNVLQFVGAVLDNDALGPVLVTEYCENGQLDKWLTSRRGRVDVDVLEEMQGFVLGLARGMEYLAGKGITHRKLAVRNCMLTASNELKIAGFGPCKTEEEENDNKGRIPVKWTAPECLKSLRSANEKSDMWSFGVTMWEILSMGQTPYSDIRSKDLPGKLRNGFRLSKPQHAEDIHYDMMKSCWHENADKRPTFTEVLEQLESAFGMRPSAEQEYYYVN